MSPKGDLLMIWIRSPGDITETFSTRPPSRTFIVNASAAMKVYGPASSGRVRKSATCASRSLAITETWTWTAR
jgi:hypothetical protein